MIMTRPRTRSIESIRATDALELPKAAAHTAAQWPAANLAQRRAVGERRGIQLDAPARRVGIEHGDRAEQRLGVRVRGAREQRAGLAHLHDPAAVHHRHAVADVLHQPQVVGDEEIRQLQPRLQVQEQLHHLRLNRDVQRRHGFVGDDERGVERQRARDADALALAAAELVRIPIEVRRARAPRDRTARPPAPGAPRVIPACG